MRGDHHDLSAVAVPLLASEPRDQSERDALEAALGTLAAIPYCVVTCDLQGNLTYVSPQTLDQHGYLSVDDLLGKSALVLVAQEDRARVLEHWQVVPHSSAGRGSVEWGISITLLRRDGTRFPAELAAAVIRDAAERPKGMVAVSRETGQLQWAQDLMRAQRDLALAVSRASTPTEAVDACLQSALQWADLAAGAGYLMNCRTGAAELCCSVDLSDQSLDTIRCIARDTPDAQLIQKGQAHYAQCSDPDFDHGALQGEGLQSWALLPVLHEGYPVACLKLYSHLPRIPDRGRRALEALAGHMGSALARIRAEERLRCSQRLEALGRFAGGIAHDFNNLLAGITGCAELMLETLEATNPLREEAEQIRAIAERGTALTSRILTFARGQTVDPKVIRLSEVIRRSQDMVSRIIGGGDVELAFHTSETPWPVKIDPVQLDQVLVNLCTNARDAMPHGGRLTVTTENVTVGEAMAAAYPDVSAGDYVVLAVADTGLGMDAETQSRVLEPFFSTKEAGMGTGLGLAVVYGIVRQTGGFLCIASEPGAGTTVRVYLPRAPAEAEARAV